MAASQESWQGGLTLVNETTSRIWPCWVDSGRLSNASQTHYKPERQAINFPWRMFFYRQELLNCLHPGPLLPGEKVDPLLEG